MPTAPRTITLGQTIELPDADYTLVGFASGAFRLRNQFTNQYIVLDHAELARVLPPGKPLETSTAKPVGSVAEELDRLDDDARILIPHLQEILEGTAPDGGQPRAEYSAHLPMKRRLESKLAELDKLGLDMSLPTLKRKLKRYREQGPSGLVDRRVAKDAQPLEKLIEPDLLAELAKLLASYEGRSKTSYSAIRAELREVLIENYPDPDERPKLPSPSSIERYVSMLTGQKNPTKGGARRQKEALTPQRPFRPRLVTSPGDECQIDTTVFDAAVLLPDGSIGRPHLSVMVDKRTRTIMGFNFTASAPTGTDHAVLIARTLVPRKLRPWSKHYAQLELPEMPWAPHLDDEMRQGDWDMHRPYIFPRRLVIDNGSDYRSVVLRETCERYGIHLTESPIHNPTTKAHVERLFGTISKKFARFLPAYVGSNTADRGSKAMDERPLDLRTVSQLFDRWVAVVYQNRQHSALVDPYQPTLRHTPNSMYAASLDLTGHFFVALEEEDFITLMPRAKRTIRPDGIELRGRKYDSPHLTGMRNQRDDNDEPVQYDMHFDPEDLSQVWVRHTEDNHWVTCVWSSDAGLSRPHERRHVEQAARLSQANTGFTNREADELTVRLRREAVREMRERTAAEAELARAQHAAARRKQTRGSATKPKTPHDYSDFMELDTF